MRTRTYVLFIGFLVLATTVASADGFSYNHQARGYSLGLTRGMTFHNSELESTSTRGFVLAKELSPNVLQLRIPFGSYEVDTRGKSLPLGRIFADSVGASLWLGFGGEHWAPFLGAGVSFHTFQEQFKSPGNLENTFGVDAYAGLRFRFVENLWDALKLRGSLHYQGSFLKPGIQVPDKGDADSLSLYRHSVVLMLEAVGL